MNEPHEDTGYEMRTTNGPSTSAPTATRHAGAFPPKKRRTATRFVAHGAAFVLLVGGLVVGVAPQVASAAGNCTSTATTTTCVFASVGAEQSFLVPTGVESVHVVAGGGSGGLSAFPGSSARGDLVSADLAVTGGATLFVEVGGNASSAGVSCVGSCVGGFNGGARAFSDGGGGGGASDVRTLAVNAPNSLSSRLLVAAGGGGDGSGQVFPSLGRIPCSAFGGPAGGTGFPSCLNQGSRALGGEAGTLSGGGVGGYGNAAIGQNGGFGFGGRPIETSLGRGRAGAGGGGYFGGGAGGQTQVTSAGVVTAEGGAGGGGGSSLVPVGGTNTPSNNNSPSIEISYLIPVAPTVSGAPPFGAVGTPYSFSFVAGGIPAPNISMTGTVPGLSLSTAGVLSGTPTRSGTFNFFLTATNALGLSSFASSIVIRPGDQTITFVAPATGTVGGTFTPAATATSGLAVAFTVDASSTGCSLAAGVVTFTGAGTCVIDANQAGNTNYNAAPQVQQSTAIATAPGVPTNVTAVAGDHAATVSWTAPVSDGGSALIGYTVSGTDTTDPLAPPVGVTFSGSPPATTFTLDGLTAGHMYTFQVAAANSADFSGFSGPSAPVTPYALPSISGTPSSGTVGTAYSFTFTTSGFPTPTVTANPTLLPPGLTLSSVGVLSGTPTASGDFTFSVTAANGHAPAATASVTVHIAGPVAQTITFTAPATGTVGGSYTPSATATSNLAVSFTVDPSSVGCSLAAGVVSFTGVGTCVIDANQGGNVDFLPAPQVQRSTIVSAAPKQNQTITFTGPLSGRVGESYTPSAASSSGLPVTFTVDASSTGCSLAAGVVTFTGAGTCVIDANQAGDASFFAAPQVQQSVTVTASAPGVPTNVTAVAGDHAATVSWTAPVSDGGSPLIGYTVRGTDTTDPLAPPAQVTFTGAPPDTTFTLLGLTAGHVYTFQVAAANSADFSGFSGPSAPVTPYALPSISGTPSSGMVASAYSFTFTTSGFPAPTVAASPTLLPPGLTLSSAGVLSGTPTASGDFTFSVTAANGHTPAATASVTVHIAGPVAQTITFTSTATAATVGGATYTPTATATSGLAVTITVDQTSVAVCSITSGIVSFKGAGTCVLNANQPGNAGFSPAPQVQQSITVNAVPAFLVASPPITATVAQPYTYTFQATGTPTPTFALAAGAPNWLSINTQSGGLTGTPPTGTTSFTYSVTAANVAGQATAGPFTVTVTAPPPPSTNADLAVSLTCPTTVIRNTAMTCTIVVRNMGPATARFVATGIVLPEDAKSLTFTASGIRRERTITWIAASLAASATVTYTVTYKPSESGRIGVGVISSSPDPNLLNNIAVVTQTVTR